MDKTFDAAEAEGRIYARWEQQGCFAAGANARPGAETFCIVIPPPNVTGSLHMGHALNNTLQDILIRWHRMRGFDTLWQPGTDHAGIATQMVVERKLAAEGNQSRRDMTRKAFVDKVWEWKQESGDTILNQLKRLGASCDWSRDRFTMDEGLSRAVLKVFVQLYNEGLIYKDKRLVNWDPHFETAISDLEVENIEVDGHMWHFKYPLADGESYEYIEKDEDGNVTLRERRDYISIATTRPETMLGDGAVAVHPSDERYAPIVGKMVHLPLCDRLIPIITDDYPDPDFGSGAVKITGAHDFNDYQVARRNGIPLYNLMTSKAALRSDEAADNLVPAKYRGMDRFEARKAVVADIDAQGLMIAVEDKKIVQPFGDRSKVVIEPWLTDQWFADAKTLAKPAIAAVRDGDVKFVPKNWENTYYHWMENIEPWCISRQLWWGHQIPVWYGAKVINGVTSGIHEQLFCAHTEAEALAMAKEYYARELARPAHVVVQGSEHNFEDGEFIEIDRDPDVLDTWFSSALWPFSTLGWPDATPELARYYKTDVLITGFDIIFFWVARMMMAGLHFMDEAPFHTVYIHALVRDEQGKKMSKAVGNVIDPLDLIDEYGADAVRFTLTSMAAMGRDIRLSVNRVEGYRNFATKLWNAARFAEINGCFGPAHVGPMYGPCMAHVGPRSGPGRAHVGPMSGPVHSVNKWIVGETVRISAATGAALASYRFNDAANGLYAHVWGVFCDWYVELAKPLLQGDDEAARDETRATMAWALDQCLKLLHPIMPFVTEELWGQIAGRDGMLIHADWPELSPDLADPAADAEMSWVIKVIEGVRSARAEINAPAGARIPMVLTGAGEAVAGRLARSGALIRRLARLSEITLADQAPRGSVTLAMEDCAINLPLAGVIDIAAEQARLNKAVAKLDKEINSLQGKLANEQFLSRAPEQVVSEQRARLAAAQAEHEKLGSALARLADLA